MIFKSSSFQRINSLTLASIYLLIFIGGLVRNLDSGMGCPDWPKCFGEWIPPSSEEELPDDYQSLYTESRVAKTERLAGYLDRFGFDQVATRMRQGSVYQDTPYSFAKAWIEYANRLVGVLIGFLIILNTIWSFSDKSWKVRFLGLSALVLVLFQGWIGSVVVSTNLLPGFISFHMMLAFLLVAVLLVQRNTFSIDVKESFRGKWIAGLMALGLLIQILMGTWVREQIDFLHFNNLEKSLWVSRLDSWFYIHRSFSLLISAAFIYLLVINRTSIQYRSKLLALGVLILFEIVLGAVMVYFEFPRLTQPLHLFVAALSFGLLFSLFLQVSNRRLTVSQHA